MKLYVVSMYGAIHAICTSMTEARRFQTELNKGEMIRESLLEDDPTLAGDELDSLVLEEGAYIGTVSINKECSL